MRLHHLSIVSILTGLAFFTSTVSADVIHVPDEFETIQGAIDAAQDRDTILVHPGTYVERINFLGKDVTVGSLFLTTGDTAYIDSTTIDGDSSGSVVRFNGGESEAALLAGLTIQNGCGELDVDELCGGGIYCRDGSPTISHCVIANNSAETGGGIFCCMVEGVPVFGPTIIDCNVRGNSANYGGGILLTGRWGVNTTGCVISDNYAQERGGGVDIGWYSSVSFADCAINGNSAGEAGGGIYCAYSVLEMTNLDVGGNCSGFQAGAIHCRESRSILTGSLLWGNEAGERCGGIVLEDSSRMLVTGATFTENRAGMVRCGIHLRTGSEATVVNSIFWRNWPAQICFGDGEQSVVTLSHCLVEEGQEGIIGNGVVNWLEANIDADPLFVDPITSDFRLGEGSPCIDAGTAFFVWEGDTLVDMSGDEYYGEAPDMGALESNYEGASDLLIPHPSSFILLSPFPNPFNRATTIHFDLPLDNYVTLSIFDVYGRRVDVVTKGLFTAGCHRLVWDGGDMPSGVYMAVLGAHGEFRTTRLTLVK